MIKNGKKKGFTIVELVIVIAVIAILAAVLIPTFSNIVDKANTSADVNVVKNLNTILLAESAGEGKNATMTDALKDAEENGYLIEKLTPTNAKNEILWDSLNDCFVLKENGATELNYCGVTPAADVEVKPYNFFKIYNTKSPLIVAEDGTVTSEYSIYLGAGAIASNVTALKVSTGIDAGNYTNLTTITYENTDAGAQAQNIIIRTNSYDTIITATAYENGLTGNDYMCDTISHYGLAKEINVVKAGNKSYHEYGTILGKLNFCEGKVVLENNSNVSFVNVPAEATPSNITIEVKNGADYGRITATTQEVLDTIVSNTTVENGSPVNSLVTTSNTVAILNGVAKTDLAACLTEFKNTPNATLELFTSFDNIYLNADNATYDLIMPANGVLDGHGYQISGAVDVSVHTSGGTLKNVNFYGSYNNSQRTQEQIDRYGNTIRGTLTSVYASGLEGTLVIDNCSFDCADWDSVQVTPKTGAEIKINKSIFKHSDTTWRQNRFIHVESSKNCDFNIIVSYCDFYNISEGIQEQAFEVYYPKTSGNMNFFGNYFDGLDTTKTYTSDACFTTLFGGHFSCVGYGSSYRNACNSVLNQVSNKPNN